MASVIGRAPARVSLIGGGTDLPEFYREHGGAVVSFAIDRYAEARISTRDQDLEIVSGDAGSRELIGAATFDRRMRTPLLAEDFLLYQKAAALHYGIRKGRIEAASGVPTGVGLASSGSIAVALCAAAATYVGDHTDRSSIAEAAFTLETDLLGRSCGKQDQYASSFGGINHIAFNRDGTVDVSPLALGRETMTALQERILLFFNGRSRRAAGPLAEQAKRSSENQDTISALKHLKELAAELRTVLEQGRLDEVGVLMDEAWASKQHLNSQVSTSEIARVYALAKRAGATGGKLAGAGLAGTLVLYCPVDAQDEVRRMLASQGWREWSVSIDTEGARVTTDVGAEDDFVSP